MVSNNKFVPRRSATKKKVKGASTNVIRLELGKLGEAAVVATGDPVFCSKCKSMFNFHSVIAEQENSNQGKQWACEFCEEKNPIDIVEEEIPKQDTIDYLLEPAPELNEAQGESNTVIFVIDTSGSMCVTTEVEGKVQLKGAFDAKGALILTGKVSFRSFFPSYSFSISFEYRHSRRATVDASSEQKCYLYFKVAMCSSKCGEANRDFRKGKSKQKDCSRVLQL